MNVKEYIASGILELYVMGALPENEAQEVTAMSRKHPEIRDEITAIEAALMRYGEIQGQKPSDQSLDRALAEIIPAADATLSSARVVGMRSNFAWAIAASLALLVSLIGNGLLFNQWKSAQKEVGRLEALNNTQGGELLTMKAANEIAKRDLAIISDPRNIVLPLPGTIGNPSALATVYWNQETHEVAILMQRMPFVPTAHQLQLWAIIDGIPVDAGVFDAEQGLYTLKNIKGAVTTFAVTIEPQGGSVNPTLNQMIVAGNVTV